MAVRIFDIQNGVVTPTVHCYTMLDLKRIMDQYPACYVEVYKYIFYMTCPDPELNPFADAAEHEREDIVMSQINPKGFSPEDDEVIAGLSLCTALYTTPTSRAYLGIKTMLDHLADYMRITTIKDGRDGNITALVNAAAKFDQIRNSYKGALKDLKDELKSQVRGGQNLAYDQELQ